MKLQTKNYKYYKIKKYFKHSNFFLIYNGTNVKNFIKLNQKLKTLDLQYHKVYNTLTEKALKKSIFKNFDSLINGLILTINPAKNSTNLILNDFLGLDEFLYLIAIKMNKKMYTLPKTQLMLQLHYRNDHLMLLKLLKSNLKIPYKLT